MVDSHFYSDGKKFDTLEEANWLSEKIPNRRCLRPIRPWEVDKPIQETPVHPRHRLLRPEWGQDLKT